MSTKPDNWWGSNERTEWRKNFDAIPWNERFFRCVWSFRKWRKAVVLGTAACHCLLENEEAAFDVLVWMADEAWSEVLWIPYPHQTRTTP